MKKKESRSDNIHPQESIDVDAAFIAVIQYNLFRDNSLDITFNLKHFFPYSDYLLVELVSS